ncbi:hypothetical protein AGMMS49992_31800 [Clostridia bacterium]|nr:hypothetical protein AGMMS49992_31800 [Clostridia bacterium]
MSSKKLTQFLSKAVNEIEPIQPLLEGYDITNNQLNQIDPKKGFGCFGLIILLIVCLFAFGGLFANITFIVVDLPYQKGEINYSDPAGVAMLLFFVPTIILTIIAMIIIDKVRMKKKTEQVNMLVIIRDSLEKEFIEKMEKTSVLKFIPPKFLYKLALHTMLGYMTNGQARNWRECTNLYDAQVSRWIVENNTCEAAKAARRAEFLAGAAVYYAATS